MDLRVAALARHRYISLTTFRRDGRAVATPVWFAVDGERILIWTAQDSGKAKRIRATGRTSIAPSDGRGKITGGALAARGCILPAEEHPRALQLLKKKYSLLKPLVDLWSRIGDTVRRKPHPVEVFLEITLE